MSSFRGHPFPSWQSLNSSVRRKVLHQQIPPGLTNTNYWDSRKSFCPGGLEHIVRNKLSIFAANIKSKLRSSESRFPKVPSWVHPCFKSEESWQLSITATSSSCRLVSMVIFRERTFWHQNNLSEKSSCIFTATVLLLWLHPCIFTYGLSLSLQLWIQFGHFTFSSFISGLQMPLLPSLSCWKTLYSMSILPTTTELSERDRNTFSLFCFSLEVVIRKLTVGSRLFLSQVSWCQRWGQGSGCRALTLVTVWWCCWRGWRRLRP